MAAYVAGRTTAWPYGGATTAVTATETTMDPSLPSNTTACCPKSYTEWRGICYKAFNTEANFEASARLCRLDGGTLAMPRDAATDAFLVSLKNSVDASSRFWFGLHDQNTEGSFEWIDGTAFGNGSYSNWGSGEPNNSGGQEDCVHYWDSSQLNTWNDMGCNGLCRFICQVVPEADDPGLLYRDLIREVMVDIPATSTHGDLGNTDGRVLVTSELDFNMRYSIPVAQLDSSGAILVAYVIHVNLTSDVMLYKNPDGLCNTTSFYVTMEENSNIAIRAALRWTRSNAWEPPTVWGSHTVAQYSRKLSVSADLGSLANRSLSGVQFSLVPGGDADRFSLDHSSGVLTPNTPLDREDRAVLGFRVAMATRYDVTFAAVTVTVTDINDNPPVIVQTWSSEYILQSTPINSIVGLVRAEDPDEGENATLTYTIVTKDDEDFSQLFFINEVTGVITVISNFKVIREHIPLKIRVLDNGEPPRVADTTLDLSLLSNEAVGNQTRLEVNVPEDVAIGTAIVNATVPASAGDGTIIYTYVMQDPSGLNERYFDVHNETGEITVISDLDREKESSHEFFVEPIADSGCARQSLILVVITLEDINDNNPVFEDVTLRGTVRENTPPGEPVTVIPELAVTDEDSGINGRVALRLTGVGSSDFGVNSTTGQIYVDGNLDYETVQSYSLTVVAMDRDGMPGHRTATALLTIELQDENDNPPQFSPENFHFFVSENSTDDALVGIVLATDLDSGQDGKVDHFIVDGGDGVFQLDPSSGNLTLVNGDLLDREAVSWYTVTIRAQKGIRSQTVPELQPTLTGGREKPIRATENLPAGSRLFAMTVTDPDDGVNGAVHLHVNSDEFSVVMLPNSTEQWTIVSNGTLDREERETYELTITATDMGTPALSSSVTIFLSVGDVNDVPPTFVDPPDEVTLLGGSHPGTLVAIFAVEDPDVNGTVTYSIAGDQDGLFGINNEGVVVLNQRLPNVVVTRNVTIAVTDGLHLTNTTLRVHVEDGSSLVSLEFGRESYNFDVIEDSAPRTVLGTVNVSIDHQVWYSFQSAQMGQHFIIDNNTGEIVARLPLDRENIAEHYLIAVATESGVASRKAYATVTVRVLDVNDNAPEFDREDYDADVSEDAPVGHTIVRPSASDADVGENARIVYSKVQGNDTFEVDPETGAVLLNGTLDRETDPIHVIVVQATDNGTSPRSATATVSVHVIDVNDNGPIFAQEYYNVSVTENDDNKLVLTALATDVDFGTNGRVRHSLIGADNFTIGELTGDISSTFNFDRESVSYYNFTVLAVDGGDPPYSSSAEISVTVADVNDNRPVFLDTPYRQKVAEDTPNYTSVFTLTATDADLGENGTVSYEENPGGICGALFLVDVTAGVMTTRQSLLSIKPTDREHCVAIVTACDHGREPGCMDVEVVFNITDANRHDPVFANNMLSDHFSEAWNVRGRQLFTVMATDADPGVNGEVSYKIVDDYGMFELRREEESVQVWANRSLDREERDFYNLTLVATDGAVVNPKNDTAALDIWVDDANDNPPKFVRDNFTMEEIRLFSNTSVGTHVTRVSSTDEDVGTNAVPLYRIAAVQDMRLDSPTHLFTINSQTGDLNISSELPKLTEDYFVNITLSVEDAMNPNLRADELKLRIVVPFISTNKHAPLFPQDNYTVELTREGLLAESGPVHLITVSAEDSDTGPDGQVDYSILNRADTWYDLLGFISMTGPNVSLHVNADGTVFNSTDDYPHRLVIQAQDRGQPAKTGTTEILLSIQEAGTEAPTPVVVAPPMPDCSTTPIIAAGCVAVFAALLAAVSLILYARNRLELKRVYSVAPEHVYEVIDLQATRLHDMKLNERTPLPPIAKQLQPDRNPLPPVREAPRHLPRFRNQPPQPRLPPVTRRSGVPRARAPPTVPKLNYSTDSSYVFENDTSESDTDGEYVDTMHTRRGNKT
ncbi:hypothetical protein Bbelb_323630 [Branchiostoma belcheri]|nr:hypothetical protein Bbelb_323630 [Branchiostoma belcheri]